MPKGFVGSSVWVGAGYFGKLLNAPLSAIISKNVEYVIFHLKVCSQKPKSAEYSAKYLDTQNAF